MAARKIAVIDVLTATAEDLRNKLEDGTVTTVELAGLYTHQIDLHNHKGLHLNAMISLAPPDQLHSRAAALDKERAEGKTRGPLHGIPVILKDNIMTEASLGMDTTCGSLALKGVKVKANATIVDLLLDAGLLILGKSNLSEWAGKKGYFIPCGWSAVGGQTQSPYIKGGFVKGDKILGHSSPCGSSSGSAAGVAAGFAPVSIGTETDGSITQPAGRASLYGLKATIGTVDVSGTSPYSDFTDSLGALTKSSRDLADLMGILMKTDFIPFLTKSWAGQKVAFVNPDAWELPSVVCDRDENLLKEQRTAVLAAADLIEKSGAKVVRHVVVPPWNTLEWNGKDGIELIWDHDLKPNIAEFLKGYKDPPVKSLEDLVKFNSDHAAEELPEEWPNGQGQLLDALGEVMSEKDYNDARVQIRRIAATEGFDRIFAHEDVDVIAGPLDGRIVSIAAAAGYPCGVVPLGYADNLNGRPHGLVLVGGARGEGKMLEFMSAWEASNPHLRRPPPLLVNWNPETS